MTVRIEERWNKSSFIKLGVGLALCWASSVQASSDALLNKLVQKGVLTQQEANGLREEMDKEDAQTVDLYNKTKVNSWVDEIKWYGEVRLRAEYFGFEQNPAAAPGIKLNSDTDRLRYRLRLRFGVEAELEKWATIGVRLASGQQGGNTTNAEGDPVSPNQDLTDTFSKKPIRIDLAYVTVHPPELDWLRVTVGKMNIPIWQPGFNSPMVYDFDATTEGIAEQLSFYLDDDKRFRLFLNAGQFALKELSTDSNDAYMYDNQLGFEAKFGKDPKKPKVKATVAGGYMITHNLGNPNFPFGDSPNKGNAVGGAATNLFLGDFQVVNGRAEVVWNVCDKPSLGTPTMLMFSGEYIKNLSDTWDNLIGATSGADPGQTEGWTAQVAFGEAKKRGQWQIAYQYKYLQADATWDAITDSDWGAGGTDRQGHAIRGVYNIRDWWQVGCTAFITRKISDRSNAGHNIAGNTSDDLLRLQVDTVFKF